MGGAVTVRDGALIRPRPGKMSRFGLGRLDRKALAPVKIACA
jgi:hypothetical protein